MRKRAESTMKRPLPRTHAQWLKEIRLAMADAREAIPFGQMIGHQMTEADLFHLAPQVCLKFRGRKATVKEAKRVTEAALANYVVNSDPDGIDNGLEQRPLICLTSKKPKRFWYTAKSICRQEFTTMSEQPNKPPLDSLETDLFGSLFGFHEKTMTLLRQSSLDEEKLNVVSERIKTLLDAVITDMEGTQQMNLTERLETAYDEVKRLVEALSGSQDVAQDR